MSEKSIYAVALVYSKSTGQTETTWKLIHRVGEAISENEAIGDAVVANRGETDGYGLQLCSVLALARNEEGER